MKRWMIFVLVLVIGSATAKGVFAWGRDFTKEQLAAAGKHCVHGYWLNDQRVAFYAGDAARLNRDLPTYLEWPWQRATRTVVIHVGTKRAESPWDAKPRDTFVDWSVTTGRWHGPIDPSKAAPVMQMQIDIWLSDKIRLEDLRIPEQFEVVSGGEIERFIQQREQKTR